MPRAFILNLGRLLFMARITVSKNDIEKSFNSLNEAKKEITGSDTPANRENCIKAITKAGWSIVSIEEKSTKAKTSLIEKVIAQATTLDKLKIKELEEKRQYIMKNFTTNEDAQKLIDINQALNELMNPKASKEDIIKWFTVELEKHLKEEEEPKEEPKAKK